ncbi:MAG: alpha/beta fold hydrolase, partial [Chloroflexota bacterium]
PKAMRSMINWYRAAARTDTVPAAHPRVIVPTRIIWGANDVALSRPLAPLSLEMCDDGELFILEQATHWVQHDEARRVNELLVDFFQEA